MSMIEGSNQQSTETQVFAAADWALLLTEESARFHTLGIRAGVISIDFAAASDAELWRDRAVRLLRRSLRTTDRIGLTGPTSVAVLQAPLQTLPQLDRTARQIDLHLQGAGLTAAIGFAHRRTGEQLLDTFARADAQADRAAFRQQHPSGDEILLS